MTLSEIPTPALVVDVDVFDANVAAAETMMAGSTKGLRPHFKTHRTPQLALRQLRGHVTGFTCATVGEAQVLVESGVTDVLLANEVVSPAKVADLVALGQAAKVTVAVDAPGPLRLLSRLAAQAGVVISVLIDLDIGLNRCGVRSLADAAALATLALKSPGVTLAGLMGYEGRIRPGTAGRDAVIKKGYRALSEAKSFLEAEGFDIRVVSAGGTATLPEALQDPDITEIQAGSYALMEPELVQAGLPFVPAALVTGTVVSRFGNRTVLDSGRRSITADRGLPPVVDPDGETVALNDEHAVIEWSRRPPELGEVVRLRPTQNRTTFNLHDFVWAVQGDQVLGRWPVSARGGS